MFGDQAMIAKQSGRLRRMLGALRLEQPLKLLSGPAGHALQSSEHAVEEAHPLC